MANQKYKIKDMVQAIHESKGMVYVAARKLGCAANTIYNYAEKHEGVRRAIDEERGMMVDTAELALWKALQNGEAWAVSLTLKMLGKDRGYAERSEHEISGNADKPLRLVIEYTDDFANDHDD